MFWYTQSHTHFVIMNDLLDVLCFHIQERKKQKTEQTVTGNKNEHNSQAKLLNHFVFQSFEHI